MTKLFAQHGAAKGKKIDNAFDNDRIQGVIMSPREEGIDTMISYFNNNNLLNKDNCLYDPQFYYSTYNTSLLKKLEELECYPQNVERKDWRKKAERLLNYFDSHVKQSEKFSNSIIVPGFHIDKLDWKLDYSLDIYSYFYEKYENKNQYLSLLISFSLFHSSSDVDEMIEEVIDSIPKEERNGIYLTICYESTSNNNYEDVDPENLANVLYFVHSLKKEGFRIIVGYTFINSLLFAMLECDIVSSGWFNTLRKFNKDRFEESDTFGRRKKRYTSIPLLTNITFDIINNFDNDLFIKCLSGTSFDEAVADDLESVSFVDLEQQYWEAINNCIRDINESNEKIEYTIELIKDAKELYSDILARNSSAVELCSRIKKASSHLDVWITAILLFKRRASIV
ncbi:hypothetical protein [Clostridium beijerinckii]|uniref:Uncharacterized protein n=1 Tax=Clostridium beijerinckii TaxID=1520 RepID=A0A1S8SA83_CLOBE|nr:hypothetical protein [Clostridium beijerinckii]NRY60866.1 hypothetical protein [Clostridium beijerinckii]OOM62309.1 hypothetical protein CLBCK_18470 [Clostridium beijerinckii]